MNRAANFFKSILPFLLVIILQFLLVLAENLFFAAQSGEGARALLDGLYNAFNGAYANPDSALYLNVLYGVLAVLIFGIWYRRSFIRPFRNKKKAGAVRGFSFHTILAILFLAIGLYYVTALVVNVAAQIEPSWLSVYNDLLDDTGYRDPSLFLILYTIVLSPVAEELIFRGLTMRYARYALPFWLANIWQALLFGLLHGNFLQGLYAFILGLFLGFIAHRGRGIRYSIPVHILYNIIGLFFSGLIGITLDLNFPIAILCGIALTIFAVWLFYTDFTPREESERDDGQKPASSA